MADRALIIAIEEYRRASDGATEKKLEGTLAAALEFKKWLEDKWQAEGTQGEILFCSHPPVNPPIAGQRGADRREIVRALIDLQKNGRDQTENLYVYFSGHGFRLQNLKTARSDVLVAEDFENLALSGDSCFKLDALIEGLRASLGPGCHYYFIDACRNEISKAIGTDIMPFDTLGSGEPSIFVLQSTVPGSPSLVGGPFAKTLIQGLRGSGTAKAWVPPVSDSMVVRFDTLRKFLADQLPKETMTQRSEGEKGESDVVLRIIKPVPVCQLSVKFTTTLPDWQGVLIVTRFNSADSDTHDITPAGLTLPLSPDDYTLEVQIADTVITPTAKQNVRLYEDKEVIFDVTAAELAMHKSALEGYFAAVPEPEFQFVDATAKIAIPTGTKMELQMENTGRTFSFNSPAEEILPGGRYTAVLSTDDGQFISRREYSMAAGESIEVAPAQWRGSLPHEVIASHFPVQNEAVDFSESLGRALPDPDLSLWLSVLGAGRILVRHPGELQKISRLPLHNFSAEPPGASPIYIIAGFPEANIPLSAGLHQQGEVQQVTWTEARTPEGMPVIREAVLHPPPGQSFLTLQFGDQPTVTLTTYAEPNRCTLVVLTLDDEGQPRLAQFLLPLGHLIPHLPPEVRSQLEYRGSLLPDVVMMARLTRAFRKRRNLKAEFDISQLNAMLFGKWVDPISTSLAFYEYLRRDRHHPDVRIAISNMSQHFRSLPDTEAILRLAQRHAPPDASARQVPLFLDGLRAFPDHAEWLPFPAGLLDFTGPWTAWRGAAPGPPARVDRSGAD